MADISLFTKKVLAATRLPNITLGNSDFPEVRRDGTLFVDKTVKLPMLLDYKKVFFARPRRFGKTTLASMIKVLFMHGTEMFKGLAVYDTWPEEQCFPVISISLYDLADPETFEADLCSRLIASLGFAGLPALKERALGMTKIDDLFCQIGYELSSHRTVWLIDEWDFPLSANLNNRPAFDANTSVLKKFFTQLRMLVNMRFMMVTGIMRYQNTSLFSGQDIVDISMDSDFADLLGYTQTELETNFAPYIARAAELLGMNREDFLEKLKLQYDGFCFDAETSVSLYCPWSINKFFQQFVRGNKRSLNPVLTFAPFWMNSAGASKPLRSFLQAHRVELEFLDQALSSELKVATSDLNDPVSFEQIDLPAIMVQSGYLSLKRISSEADASGLVYYCGVPNLEIKNAFVRVAYKASMSAKMGQRKFDQVMDELSSAVSALDLVTMTNALNELLVCIYYDAWAAFIESHYRSFISWSLLATDSVDIVREETYNSHGRSDIEIEYDGKLLVIELKRLKAGASQQACLSLAQEAQDQILGGKYSQNSAAMQRPLYKERNAAVWVISDKERQIVYWRLLSLDKAKLKQDPLLGEGWVVPLPLEESEAAANDASEKPKKRKKSVKRGTAKQAVARDESQPATSGEVTLVKSEKDAGASPSGEGEASDAACAGTASLPQGEVKTNPALDMTDGLDIAFDIAQQLADSADTDNVVTLDPAMLARGMQSYAAKLQNQKGQHTPESIKSYVGRYIDVAQTAPTPNGTMMDRTFLEQQLVALLTKLL